MNAFMDTLVKKLNFVGVITTNSYNLGWYIYDLVVEDKCEIVSIKSNEYFYNQWHKLNIKDKEEWVTYGDCRKMSFHYINGQIAVEVRTYTHGILGIDRRQLKWEAQFFLPIDFVNNIQAEIDRAFDKFCEKAYDDHLESLRLQWIKKFKGDLLSE